MKKNKILLGLGTISSIIAPIAAVVSCGTTNKKNETVSNIADVFKTTAQTTETNSNDLTGLDGRAPLINSENPTNLRGIEESIKPKKDANVWTEKYTRRTFNDSLIKQWYENAVKNGWTSIEKYQMYQQYVLESGASSTRSSNIFGIPPSNANTSWLAYHFGPGVELAGSRKPYGFIGDWNANMSEVSPTWSGAENEKWNDIDNSLAWYHYEGAGSKQFLFNENNKENAVKRLESMQRLQRVSPNGISTETDSNNTVRNYVMLDGVLTDVNNLPFGNYKMYYVNDMGDLKNEDGFIRDDHGWKVVVTDRNLETMLTGVINPTCDATIAAHPEVTDTVLGSKLPLYDGARRAEVTKTAYAADYTVNSDFDLNHKFSKELEKTDISYYIGRYTITQKAESFTALTNNPLIHLPFKDVRGSDARMVVGGQQKTSTMPDRFGRMSKYHDIYGEDELHLSSWAWVENGQGGYKIWPSAKRLRYALDHWNRPSATVDATTIAHQTSLATKWNTAHQAEITAGTAVARTYEDYRNDEGEGYYRFFGCWRRIYPVKEWFTKSEFVMKERGI